MCILLKSALETEGGFGLYIRGALTCFAGLPSGDVTGDEGKSILFPSITT